jgi:hypothetical protein
MTFRHGSRIRSFLWQFWSFAQQALLAGDTNQATLWCYSYVGQTWPDPAANAIAPKLAEACQKAVQTGGLTYYPTWGL